MRGHSRDIWLVAIALTLLVVCVVAMAALQSIGREAALPYASTSSSPEGTLAMAEWLRALGYRVSLGEANQFRIPPTAAMGIIIEPSTLITQGEWEALDEWVESGGTLLVAGRQGGTSLAFQHYDFRLRGLNAAQTRPMRLQNPLMIAPPVTTTIAARPRAYLQPARDDFVVHLAIAQGPVMVSFLQGDGQVILCTTPYPFTNEGIREEGNPEMVLNVVNAALRDGTIWIDEWHHGQRGVTRTIIGPQQWLFRTPPGRSLLYAAGVVFAALLLRGRRFGRPLPPPGETARRAPMEYITAMANLTRRAGHRDAMLEHYHHELKRGLGHRYRLSPTLPDEEFVRRLADYRPDMDEAALRRLLMRFYRTNVSESELVQLAAEVVRWLEQFQGTTL